MNCLMYILGSSVKCVILPILGGGNAIMPNLTEIHMKIFYCRELLYQIRLEWSPIKTVSSTLVVKKK